MNDEDLRQRFRRDFTKEKIGDTAPAPKPPQPNQALKEPSAPAPAMTAELPHIPDIVDSHRPEVKIKRSKKTIFLLFLGLVIFAGLAGSAYWYWANKLAIPVPSSVRAAVDFPLLYPTELPTGFSLKKNSFSVSKDVVVFEAVNTSSVSIAFSDQKKPIGFDFATFYKQGLTSSTTFNTNIGEAAIGNANGRLLGSVTTDQSWLLVTSDSSKVTSANIRLILQNLKIAPANTH